MEVIGICHLDLVYCVLYRLHSVLAYATTTPPGFLGMYTRVCRVYAAICLQIRVWCVDAPGGSDGLRGLTGSCGEAAQRAGLGGGNAASQRGLGDGAAAGAALGLPGADMVALWVLLPLKNGIHMAWAVGFLVSTPLLSDAFIVTSDPPWQASVLEEARLVRRLAITESPA